MAGSIVDNFNHFRRLGKKYGVSVYLFAQHRDYYLSDIREVKEHRYV